MPLDLLIERWFAIGWVIFGVSHLLYPDKWAALFLPLRERETGGLLMASFTLPVGLIAVLTHNIWVWDLPVIVTLAGWLMILKSLIYLFFPRAALLVMPDGQRMRRGFRIAGGVVILLGVLMTYESFLRR